MVWDWEWVLSISLVISLLAATCCICCQLVLMQEPPTEETEMCAFDAHIKKQRTQPAVKLDVPPSDQEATGVGVRQRTSRQENLTAEDIINACRDEPDAQGSSGDAVGVAGPSEVDSSQKKNEEKIAGFQQWQ